MRWTAGMIWLMCIAVWPVQAQDNPYLQQLIQKSRDLRLEKSQEWLNLLHYKPYPLWPGARSLADDPSFFNAADGMDNPAAELEATLKVFFSDMEETDKQQNPQCRFIARYHWLHERLQFDPVQMPVRECRRYNNWRKALNPHEITLVFPAAFLNSPASMYGHTLLRIDAKDQDERTRLLAYTIGYTASTNETNGLLFAYMGLTGGYPGIFQTMPYYLKVREYSDMENRDIWEYRLNLNAQEIERMMMHIWEVGPTYFAYYFLDENCAYHLLSLLEVARPSLRLTDEFRWWAIPSDTVRAVTEHPDLLVDVVYRPSNATIITQRLREMPVAQRVLAKALSMGELTADTAEIRALPLAQQAAITELGLDYLTYLQSSDGESAEKSARVRKLLLARSALDSPSAMPLIKTPSVRPDQGHRSLRVGAGGGNRDGIPYQEFAVRPAYHDQNDPADGYIRGAQIQFFNFRLRHYGDEAGMRIEEFVPIDIFSLTSRNDFFQSLSWKVNVGWARKRLAENNEPLITRLNAGGGYAWDAPSLDKPWAQIYTLLESTLESTPQYNGHYAWGAGPSAGIITDITDNWRLNAYARVQRFALGEAHTVPEISLLQRYALGKQSALRLEISRKAEFERYWSDINVAWQVYF
ncbi:MAG: DUF4105 domain-containing protein [Gallionellaceae bacterium]